MLCPSLLTPLPLSVRPWPVRSLWPETHPLIFHLEQEMMRHLQEVQQEVQHRMELMERLHRKIFEQIDSSSSSSCSSFRPITFQELWRDGGLFSFSLDTKDFSPEQLSVKQVGRRLQVSGRSESQQEDRSGSLYRCQEFRQELNLPEGVDPEAVTCSLVGGQLQIQAPRHKAVHDGKERVVPITVAPAITSSSTSSSSGGAEESCSSENKTENTE